MEESSNPVQEESSTPFQDDNSIEAIRDSSSPLKDTEKIEVLVVEIKNLKVSVIYLLWNIYKICICTRVLKYLETTIKYHF